MSASSFFKGSFHLFFDYKSVKIINIARNGLLGRQMSWQLFWIRSYLSNMEAD